MPTALFIGAHNDEVEVEFPILPQLLSRAGWRVVILIPIGGPSQAAVDAAKTLGCEKVLWDYIGCRLSSLLDDMTARLEKFLRELGPQLIFIHWPHDCHPDHRVVAKASVNAVFNTTKLISDDHWNKEVWAFPAGISQTYSFWPDVLVTGDAELMENGHKAMECFGAGKRQTDLWWRDVQVKASWWGTHTGGIPAEGYKYIGPNFPVDGLLLKKVLGDRLRGLDLRVMQEYTKVAF